jgi:hypothetical protein
MIAPSDLIDRTPNARVEERFDGDRLEGRRRLAGRAGLATTSLRRVVNSCGDHHDETADHETDADAFIRSANGGVGIVEGATIALAIQSER